MLEFWLTSSGQNITEKPRAGLKPGATYGERRRDVPNYDYDMLVIGSGPAGHQAAIQTARLGKKVAAAERKGVVGGVCINRLPL